MAEPQQQQQQQGMMKRFTDGGGGGVPSPTKVLAVLALFPLGGGLLFISGIAFAATLVGLVLATPLFVIFSPVLVPAALVLALAVGGFMTSGAFGITALSAISWIVSFLRGPRVVPSEQLRQVGQRMQEAAGRVDQKAQETVKT